MMTLKWLFSSPMQSGRSGLLLGPCKVLNLLVASVFRGDLLCMAAIAAGFGLRKNAFVIGMIFSKGD